MILFGTSNKLYLAKSDEATILAEVENEDFTDYKQVGFISESEVFTMVAGQMRRFKYSEEGLT